jgi:hypothetical protein
MRRYPHNARRRLARQPDNRAQRDQPGGRNRPSGKDRTPLLLRSLASQHFDDGAAPATRWRRSSPLELPAARRNSSSAPPNLAGSVCRGQRCQSFTALWRARVARKLNMSWHHPDLYFFLCLLAGLAAFLAIIYVDAASGMQPLGGNGSRGGGVAAR